MAASPTRDRIVKAATELFLSKGYGSTSIADILSRSQVNSGSLYYVFPGKQDVLLAVLDFYRDNIGEMLLQPAWAGIDDPIEKIFALLGRYRELIILTDCQYGCPIGSLALELHEPDPVVRDRLAVNFDGWVSAVREQLERAADRFPPDFHFQSTAEFVLTVMEGGVMQARTYRDVGYFDRAVAQLRAYLNAMMTKGEADA